MSFRLPALAYHDLRSIKGESRLTCVPIPSPRDLAAPSGGGKVLKSSVFNIFFSGKCSKKPSKEGPQFKNKNKTKQKKRANNSQSEIIIQCYLQRSWFTKSWSEQT